MVRTFCLILLSVTAEESETSLKSTPRTYGQHASKMLAERIEHLENQLPQLMEAQRVPGVSVAAIENRRLAWSRGFGVRCAGARDIVGPDTVMEACSMSKPFFAYMLLAAVEQQNFDLDKPLVDYLGADYIDGDPRHRTITARMALSHTTGLPNWRRGGWRSDSPMSLAFTPGTKFRYSGEGFLMLQRAVEKLTDVELDRFSQQKLINPLGLRHTRYVWDDRLMAHAACGHDRDGKVKPERKYYDRANAAYSLYTTAEDYARFIVEVLQAKRPSAAEKKQPTPSKSSTHTISHEMRKQMLTPISHREDEDADWGLGWGLRKRENQLVVYHSGANGSGFRCYCEVTPADGDGLVIMTNALNGDKLWEAVMEDWGP